MWKKFRLLLLCAFIISSTLIAHQQTPAAASPSPAVSAQDLLDLVNGLRNANGLSYLTVNSILMSTAQSTAQAMADNNLTWHIGATSDRVAAAGYGGGSTVWATENFAVGSDGLTIEQIQTFWADALHMIPMTNPIYCDLGAGVATASDGSVYYVVHAAYSSTHSCGEYIGPNGITLPTIQSLTSQAGGSTPEAVPTNEAESQWMAPVLTVTPNENGELIHEVLYGHTLWSIAKEYGINYHSIKEINGMVSDDVYAGQELLIPTPEFWALTLTTTPTSTKISIEPVIVATQSKSTPTPTKFAQPTTTITNKPDQNILTENNSSNNGETNSIGTMMMVVVFAAILIMGLSLWQPWKTREGINKEEEDPLNTPVE